MPAAEKRPELDCIHLAHHSSSFTPVKGFSVTDKEMTPSVHRSQNLDTSETPSNLVLSHVGWRECRQKFDVQDHRRII